MRAFVMCDGEESQIRIFQEQEIRDVLAEELVDFGKTPASCSAILQSSDVSLFFKSTKQLLKTVLSQPSYKSTMLQRNLKTAFTYYRQQRTTDLSSAMESKIIDSLQQICYTIHKSLNPDIVKKGYIDCGQDAPISLDENGYETFTKYDKCMGKCTRKLSTNEYQVMKDQFIHFVLLMRNHGRITEAEMDEKNIPNYNNCDSDKKPKDQRALHKQRAVIMNAEDCVAAYANYQQRRQQAIAMETQRRLQRTVTAGERQAARVAKEAEKRRRATLTEDERKAEANNKRRATLARKRLEQQERLEQQQEQGTQQDVGADISSDDDDSSDESIISDRNSGSEGGEIPNYDEHSDRRDN